MPWSFAQRARARLTTLSAPDTLEECWAWAALETVANGRKVSPDARKLRQLTMPAVVWLNLPAWPMEFTQARLAAVLDTARWACGDGDVDWLLEIDRCWQSIPEPIRDEVTVLRARGELGLALGPHGARPYGWDAEELELLREDFLSPDDPCDQAWQALAEGDISRASNALERYDPAFENAGSGWTGDDETVLRQIMTFPARVLGVEVRALRALIERATAATL